MGVGVGVEEVGVAASTAAGSPHLELLIIKQISQAEGVEPQKQIEKRESRNLCSCSCS